MSPGRDGPRYEVTLLTPEDLFFCSIIQAGLFELEHRGIVRLRFRLNLDFHQPGVFISGYRVNDLATGRRGSFAADMRDAPDGFLPSSYQGFDLLFKRNHQAAVIDREVAAEQRDRIRPAGLAYQVRSGHDHHRWLLYAGAALHTLKHIGQTGIRDPRRDLLAPLGHALLWKMRRHWRTRAIDHFERQAPDSEDAWVLFQPRVFDPDPRFANHLDAVVDSKHEVNRMRVAILRALKARLPGQFRGGLVADAYARRRYPGELSPQSTRQADYLDAVGRAGVVVYSNGLNGSPAFKLAEYLAAGKCVVAERLRCQLPAPLEDGRHLVYFDSPEECAERCAELLRDPDRRRRIGLAARRYYESHVEPSRTALRMIETTLATGLVDQVGFGPEPARPDAP